MQPSEKKTILQALPSALHSQGFYHTPNYGGIFYRLTFQHQDLVINITVEFLAAEISGYNEIVFSTDDTGLIQICDNDVVVSFGKTEVGTSRSFEIDIRDPNAINMINAQMHRHIRRLQKQRVF